MQDKPNIIIILLDTLRADRLSCYGYYKETSPNIDKIAELGILFENAIVSAPWTIPSHASLFTGLYPFEHKTTDETLCLASNVPTMAELLTEAGYHTVAHATDNAWFSNEVGLLRGFSEIYGPVSALKQKKSLTERIKAYIKNRILRYKPIPSSLKAIHTAIGLIKKSESSDQPFFLFMNLMNTHMPYKPDKDMYRPYGLDKCEPDEIDFLQKKFKEYRVCPEKLNKKQLEILSSLYNACVSTVDRQLAELFKAVNNAENNTVVVITADHGECLGEHGLLNHWLCLYETLLKVPLIISYPARFFRPARFNLQVQQHDLFYTILEISGYKGDGIDSKTIMAKSLLQYIERNTPFPEYTVAEHAFPEMTVGHIRKYKPDFNDDKLVCAKQMIRSNKYKYIHYDSGHEELFDIINDSKESKNIISANRNITETMRKCLEESRSTKSAATPSSLEINDFNEETKECLEDLGYI